MIPETQLSQDTGSPFPPHWRTLYSQRCYHVPPPTSYPWCTALYIPLVVTGIIHVVSNLRPCLSKVLSDVQLEEMGGGLAYSPWFDIIPEDWSLSATLEPCNLKWLCSLPSQPLPPSRPQLT